MHMMITADRVGIQTGGGLVTDHESRALAEAFPYNSMTVGRDFIESVLLPNPVDPWCWDEAVVEWLRGRYRAGLPTHAHFYAGTFTKTIEFLKSWGCKISYTTAAHDVKESRREHEELGLQFDYPHLTDPALWQRYVGGYLAADVLICPSRHSASVMRGFGARGRIEVIPHGVDVPGTFSPLPSRFTVGYLGAYGPDKGVRYLLEAWKRLDYDDAVLLLGGRDSRHPVVKQLIRQIYGGRVWETGGTFGTQDNHAITTLERKAKVVMVGWLDKIEEFYNAISLYVQPSVTEGFGIEVLEAMAHSRPVITSTGAGASDCLLGYDIARVGPRNVEQLASAIDLFRRHVNSDIGHKMRSLAENYTWDKIRQRYQEVWKSL